MEKQESEIEITQLMIDAGGLAMLGYDDALSDACIKAVYIAMEAARRRNCEDRLSEFGIVDISTS